MVTLGLNFDIQAVERSKEEFAKSLAKIKRSGVADNPKDPTSLGEVGDRNLAAAKDALEDGIRLGNVTATNVRDTRQRPAHETDAKSNSSMMFVSLAAAAIAVVYFSTR